MTDKQYYKEKYVGVLEEFKKFPVWSREQVKSYLHISHDTMIRLSDLGLMNRFKVQQQTYYSSIFDKYISNDKIKKSIMNVDSYYRLKPLLEEQFSNFSICDDLTDKSLISKNVKMIGVDGSEFNTKYYFYFILKPLITKKDYENLIDTILDIYWKSETDYISVYLVIHSTNYKDVLDYLDNSGRLTVYTMNRNIEYETITVNSPHIDCLR